MSKFKRKTVRSTLNLALVMCLSLWAYYIQIKGEFTDRRQAPAPISNQDGSLRGTMWCTHMWPQPHSMTPECPPGVLHKDQERESYTLTEEGVMHFKIRTHLWTQAECIMIYIVLLLQCEDNEDERRRKAAHSCGVICLFEGLRCSRLSLSLFQSLSESLFVTLLLLPWSLYLITQWRLLYPCLCVL